MAYLEKYLLVKTSQLPQSGKGLFTTIPIKKGDYIVEYKGKRRRWKDVRHLDGYNGYLMYINRNVVIDAEPTLNALGRYANDARGFARKSGLRNNATYVVDGTRCFIEATRTIKKNEEILVYYGREYWQLMRKIRNLTKVIPPEKINRYP